VGSWDLLRRPFVERLSGIILPDIVSDIISCALDCRLQSALRDDRIGLGDCSPPGVGSLIELFFELFFDLLFCHYQFGVLLDCFGFGLSVLFENLLELTIFLVVA
jgi:hypothetical protein